MAHRLSDLVDRAPATEIEWLAAIGRRAMDLGLFDVAEDAARRGLAVSADSLVLASLSARAMEARGEPRRAAETLAPPAASAATTPEGRRALLEVARLHRSLGDRQAEKEILDLAVHHHPTSFDVILVAAERARERGEREHACALLERALAANGDAAPALLALGRLRREWGDTARAIELFEKALSLDPTLLVADQARLAALRSTTTPPEDVFTEHLLHHVRFGRVGLSFAAPIANTGRRRLVFLLPEEVEAVEPQLWPLLEHLDRTRFDLRVAVRYPSSDEAFGRLAARADGSFRFGEASSIDIARRLANEGTDIAVDMGGHLRGSLVDILRFRAAPLQVSWIGAMGTTGLPSVDLRITDAVLDPAPSADALHVERLVRLEGCAFPFRADDIPVVERSSGPIVFGSFADASHLDDRTLAAFCEVLAAVPDARLVLASAGVADVAVAGRVAAIVGPRAAVADRIELTAVGRGQQERLSRLGEVDVILDTLGGGDLRALCEAPWMGVPFVTLEGAHAGTRVGASIARALGLGDLVARDLAEYVRIAAQIAADQSTRAGLRHDLRRRLSATLGDGAGFAARFADALDLAARDATPRAAPSRGEEATALGADRKRRAEEAQRSGSAHRAAALALSATLAIPDDAEAHNLLGNTLVALGDEERAERAYERSAECDRALFKPLNNLANLASKRGDKARALELFQEALQRSPNAFRVHANLGATLAEVGMPVEATAHLRRSLELQPNPMALVALARILLDAGTTREALGALEAACRFAPLSFESELFLAEALFRADRRVDAARALERAAAVSAGDKTKTERVLAELTSRGLVEVAAGVAASKGGPVSMAIVRRIVDGLSKPPRDIDAFLEAVGERRRMYEAFLVLHDRLDERGDAAGLEKSLRLAVTAFPDSALAKRNLGLFLDERGRAREAEALYRAALASAPDDATTELAYWRNRGNDGRVDEAIAGLVALRRSAPEVATTQTIIAFMNYSDTIDAQRSFEEHRAWGRRLEGRIEPLELERRSGRPKRIKVGYVSPDFREHSIARFIEPILRAHDRERFDVHVYHTLRTRDAVTERIAGANLSFHHVHDLDDDALARRIAADGIDVLVDLSGHTEHNRLPVFARRPAPVQVTYLGYPGTTGLTRIHYRITDSIADPVGPADAYSTEELVRLPSSAWCFDTESGVPLPPPRPQGSPVTFGSFNTLRKTTPEVVAVFCEVLSSVAGSRLVLKTGGLERPEIRARFASLFEAHGIGVDRVDLRGWDADRRGHLRAYGEIDVALDPFPYGGTTTTCEALFMGVPVISLAGTRHAGRVGCSLLSSVGLESLVAPTTRAYVALARELSLDAGRRAELRRTLRDRMRGCALGNPEIFVPQLEKAYDEMFARSLAAPRDAETAGEGSRVEQLSETIAIELPLTRSDATAYRVVEGTATRSVDVVLARRCLEAGDTVVDVGAELGVFALSAASIVGARGSVLAIEPDPRASRHLAKSARRNGFDWLLVERGAADGAGEGLSPRCVADLGERLSAATLLRLSSSAVRATLASDLAPFAETGPLVCFEHDPSSQPRRAFAHSLVELGYGVHAWLDAAACLEAADLTDRRKRWLVAVPRARTTSLVGRGLLARADDGRRAGALEPSADALRWFGELPYVQALIGRPAELPFALRKYVVARTSPSPSIRSAALRSALAAAFHDVESRPSTTTKLTLARIALDVGELDLGARLLGELERDVREVTDLEIAEPFLCVDARFERFEPAPADASRWLLAQVVERRLFFGSDSTFELTAEDVGAARAVIDSGYDDGSLGRGLEAWIERQTG